MVELKTHNIYQEEPCQGRKHYSPYRCDYVPASTILEILLKYPKLSNHVFVDEWKKYLGYSITDIKKLYESIAQPDSTIANTVLGAIADYVSGNDISECSPKTIESAVENKLQSLNYGIKFEHIKLTGYSIVRTYRLIQDGSWVNDGITLTNKK